MRSQVLQGNEPIRSGGRSRQGEVVQTGEPAEVGRLARLIMVQVPERNTIVTQDVAEAARANQVFNISPVSRPLRDDNLGGPFSAAKLNHGRDYLRMSIDDLIAVIFHEVRLEHNPLAGQRHTLAEGLALALENAGQVGVVVGAFGDVNPPLPRLQPQPTQRLNY